MNSDKATEGVQDDPYTLGEVLISMAMLLAVVIIYVFVAGFLDDQPHGMQIATLIGYSGAIFIFTFRRSHYVSTRYSVRAPYVQRQLPRLLLIHCVYLLALYVLGGWIPRMRLPPGSRRDLRSRFHGSLAGGSLKENSQPRERSRREVANFVNTPGGTDAGCVPPLSRPPKLSAPRLRHKLQPRVRHTSLHLLPHLPLHRPALVEHRAVAELDREPFHVHRVVEHQRSRIRVHFLR
jgi:hypothetical protein